MTAAAIQPTRPPLQRLTAVELRKSVDTRAGFWLLFLVAITILAVVVIVVAVGDAEDQTFAGLFGGTIGVASIFLPIVGLLLMTSEWSQRTALTTFTLVPERERVVLAKTLAGCALAIAAVVVCLACAALGNLIIGGSWEFDLSHLGEGALYELFGMLSALALGLLLMHSALAIVTYFVLPTVVGIAVEVIPGAADSAMWYEPTRSTTPLTEGTINGAEWAHFGVTAAIWVGVPLVLGLLRLRRHELK